MFLMKFEEEENVKCEAIMNMPPYENMKALRRKSLLETRAEWIPARANFIVASLASPNLANGANHHHALYAVKLGMLSLYHFCDSRNEREKLKIRYN